MAYPMKNKDLAPSKVRFFKAYASGSSSSPFFPLLGGTIRPKVSSKAFSDSSHSSSRAASLKRSFWLLGFSLGLVMGLNVGRIGGDVI